MKVLMIDNYDSFTYNLLQYLGELSVDVEVVRNDRVTVQWVEQNEATHIMISPGPGTPDKAGISMQVIQAMAGIKPVFGVCLGHQCIGQLYGARIVHAQEIKHGKTSMVYHNEEGVFAGLENPYQATRYHSLVIEKDSLPDCLEVTAWTENKKGGLDEIMGIRHKSLAVEGVQFHPESILTQYGHDLLQNFMTKN